MISTSFAASDGWEAVEPALLDDTEAALREVKV